MADESAGPSPTPGFLDGLVGKLGLGPLFSSSWGPPPGQAPFQFPPQVRVGDTSYSSTSDIPDSAQAPWPSAGELGLSALAGLPASLAALHGHALPALAGILAGQRGATALASGGDRQKINLLNSAKVMASKAGPADGDSPAATAIWKATGWNQDPDGKWNFELDDSQAKLGNVDQLTLGKNPYLDSRKYRDPTTLGQVLDHTTLYSAYPDLRDAPVRVVDSSRMGPSSLGGYSPSSGAIELNSSLLTDPQKLKSTLLHEVQHGVQDIEGFATGGNPKLFKLSDPVIQQVQREGRDYDQTVVKPAATAYFNLLAKAKQEWINTPITSLNTPLPADHTMVPNQTPDPDRPWANFRVQAPDGKLYNPSKTESGALQNFNSQKMYADIEEKSKLSPEYEAWTAAHSRAWNMINAPQFEAYRRIKGEVQSRNVQNRMDLTGSERAALPPGVTQDYPNSQQINAPTVGGVQPSYSLEPVLGNPFTK